MQIKQKSNSAIQMQQKQKRLRFCLTLNLRYEDYQYQPMSIDSRRTFNSKPYICLLNSKKYTYPYTINNFTAYSTRNTILAVVAQGMGNLLYL